MNLDVFAIKKGRKPDYHWRREHVDKETLRDLELKVQGFMVKRQVGCLTESQHQDLLQLQVLQAYNMGVDGANLHDEFEKVGVVPFYDEEDGEFYVAAALVPNDYYWEMDDHRTCGIKAMKNLTVIFCVFLVLNSFGSIMLWCYVDFHYPIEFMQELALKHKGGFHAKFFMFDVGANTALMSLWVGSLGFLSILCCRPALMKPAFTFVTITIIPVTLHAFVIMFTQRILSAENFREVLLERMDSYNQSVYWTSTYKSGMGWDNLQASLECCGIDDYKDWLKRSAWGDFEKRAAKSQKRSPRLFPESCCIRFDREVNTHRLKRDLDYGYEMLFCQLHSSKQVHHFKGCLEPGLRFFADFAAAVMVFSMLHNLLTILACISIGKLYVERRRQTQPEYVYSLGSWVMDFLIAGYCKDFYQDPVLLKRISYAHNTNKENMENRFRPANFDLRDRDGNEQDSRSRMIREDEDDDIYVLLAPPGQPGSLLDDPNSKKTKNNENMV